MKKNILMLPGDGIGPEIIAEARKIVLCINERTDLNLEITEREIGGSSYDIHKKPITAEVLSIAKKLMPFFWDQLVVQNGKLFPLT